MIVDITELHYHFRYRYHNNLGAVVKIVLGGCWGGLVWALILKWLNPCEKNATYRRTDTAQSCDILHGNIHTWTPNFDLLLYCDTNISYCDTNIIISHHNTSIIIILYCDTSNIILYRDTSIVIILNRDTSILIISYCEVIYSSMLGLGTEKRTVYYIFLTFFDFIRQSVARRPTGNQGQEKWVWCATMNNGPLLDSNQGQCQYVAYCVTTLLRRVHHIFNW